MSYKFTAAALAAKITEAVESGPKGPKTVYVTIDGESTAIDVVLVKTSTVDKVLKDAGYVQTESYDSTDGSIVVWSHDDFHITVKTWTDKYLGNQMFVTVWKPHTAKDTVSFYARLSAGLITTEELADKKAAEKAAATA